MSGEDVTVALDRGASTAVGSRVEFVDVPDEAARKGRVTVGMPEWLVHHFVAVFGLMRQGRARTDHRPGAGVARVSRGASPSSRGITSRTSTGDPQKLSVEELEFATRRGKLLSSWAND
jgi:hypothetical protein